MIITHEICNSLNPLESKYSMRTCETKTERKEIMHLHYKQGNKSKIEHRQIKKQLITCEIKQIIFKHMNSDESLEGEHFPATACVSKGPPPPLVLSFDRNNKKSGALSVLIAVYLNKT